MTVEKRPLPKPPADALLEFRCQHGPSSTLVGWLAADRDGGYVLTARDDLGNERSWMTYKLAPAGLDDMRQFGHQAHCGRHMVWLEGDDFDLPDDGDGTRRVMKPPTIR